MAACGYWKYVWRLMFEVLSILDESNDDEHDRKDCNCGSHDGSNLVESSLPEGTFRKEDDGGNAKQNKTCNELPVHSVSLLIISLRTWT